MATSDGPISQGIRQAISAAMARGMTAYKIAADARLAPSQLYRFLAEDPEKRRGLSLEALDGIAKALSLEMGTKRAADATATHPQVIAEGSVLIGPVNDVDAPEVASNAPDRPAVQGKDRDSGGSPRPYLSRRESKQLEAARWSSYYHITSNGLGYPERRINVAAFEELWEGGVKFAVETYGSPGIQELWTAHSQRTPTVGGARIAFWEFVSNVARNNPLLLGVENLASLFEDLKRLIRNPDKLGRIAGLLESEDAAFSLREDATSLIARLEEICKNLQIKRAIDYDWNLSFEEKRRKWDLARKERNSVLHRQERRSLLDEDDIRVEVVFNTFAEDTGEYPDGSR